MNYGSANRRDILRIVALLSLTSLIPGTDRLFTEQGDGSVVSIGRCEFPHPMTLEEYIHTVSEWQDAEQTRSLLSQFESAGLLLEEKFEFYSNAAEWTLKFRDLASFRDCHARLSTLFNDHALKRDGFKRRLTVIMNGETSEYREA